MPLLKKGKNINEQIPELKKMFGDIKILRLKKATWVDGQILMQPILTEEQKKQNAILSNNYVPDLQLKSLLDFIDIGDPSIINFVYGSISKLYERMAQTGYAINYT